MSGDGRLRVYGRAGAPLCIVRLTGREAGPPEGLSAEKFAFAELKIEDANRELSPWPAPAVFGDAAFGGGAEETLRLLLERLLPEAERALGLKRGETKFLLGGYSLSALFALWVGWRTDAFYGIAAASPSVWFPGWDEFIEENPPLARKIYLSLGDREHKTRNLAMKKVAERIRLQYAVTTERLGAESCVLEWNPGNHFQNAGERLARGYEWLCAQAEGES